MKRVFAIGLLIVLGSIVLGACAGPPLEPGPIVTTPTISIESMRFTPVAVTIAVGDTVTWQWNDGEIQHDVSGDGFDSPVQTTGTFAQTFNSTGTFAYTCSLHGNMKGTVFVVGT